MRFGSSNAVMHSTQNESGIYYTLYECANNQDLTAHFKGYASDRLFQKMQPLDVDEMKKFAVKFESVPKDKFIAITKEVLVGSGWEQSDDSHILNMINLIEELSPSDYSMISNFSQILFNLKRNFKKDFICKNSAILITGKPTKYEFVLLGFLKLQGISTFIASTELFKDTKSEKLNSEIAVISNAEFNEKIKSFLNLSDISSEVNSSEKITNSKVDTYGSAVDRFDNAKSIITSRDLSSDKDKLSDISDVLNLVCNKVSKNISANVYAVEGVDSAGEYVKVLNSIDVKHSNDISFIDLTVNRVNLTAEDFKDIRFSNKESYLSPEMISYYDRYFSNREISTKFVEFLRSYFAEEHNTTVIFNNLCTLLTFARYFDFSKKVFFIWGFLKRPEVKVLDFFRIVDKHVFVWDPDAIGNLELVKTNKRYFYHKLSTKSDIHFPEATTVKTIAYSVKQEIDTVLYSGDTPGLYRDRQFSSCNVVTLQSTLDDIAILWDKDNMIRPGFQQSSNLLQLPVIFSVIKGYSKESLYKLSEIVKTDCIWEESFNSLDKYFTDTKMSVRHLVGVNNTKFSEQKYMYRNGKTQIKDILEYPTFPYRHLDKHVQEHIVSAIAKLLDNKQIKQISYEEDFIDTVLNVGLNITSDILDRIQSYDFTKKAPKLCITLSGTDVVSAKQAIFLQILHNIGFDILLFIPSGYSLLSQYFDQNVVTDILIGNFDPSVKVSKDLLKEGSKKNKNNVLNKLFGRWL